MIYLIIHWKDLISIQRTIHSDQIMPLLRHHPSEVKISVLILKWELALFDLDYYAWKGPRSKGYFV